MTFRRTRVNRNSLRNARVTFRTRPKKTVKNVPESRRFTLNISAYDSTVEPAPDSPAEDGVPAPPYPVAAPERDGGSIQHANEVLPGRAAINSRSKRDLRSPGDDDDPSGRTA